MIPNFSYFDKLFRNGGSFDFRSSAAREAQSKLKRDQARKQRQKMAAHNKRQKKLNKQHKRRQ